MSDTEKRLAEIRERAEKATAGEWRPVYRKNGTALIEIRAPNGYAVIDAEEYAGDCWINSADADVDFIVHARDDISFLLTKIKMGDEEREKRFGHYVADCMAAILGEPATKGDHACTNENMASMHNAWNHLYDPRSRLEQEGAPPIVLRDTQPDYQRICTPIDRLTAERDAAWVAGRDAAAQVADMYAEENIEMAGDSILTDPCLSGKGFTPENIKTSESRMIDGCIHSSMYHAATNIAAAIRALSPSTLNKPE